MWNKIRVFLGSIWFIFSLGGAPDDFTKWDNWVGLMTSMLNQDIMRWMLGFVGLFFIYSVTDHYKKHSKSFIVKSMWIVTIVLISIVAVYSFINYPFNEPTKSQEVTKSEGSFRYDLDIYPSSSVTSTIPVLNESAFTGSLEEGNKEVRKEIQFGDTHNNKGLRAFISFDISKLIKEKQKGKGIETISAELILDISRSGDLNKKYFHAVNLETIILSDNLNISYFEKDGLNGREIPFVDFARGHYLVKEEISELINNVVETATFRLSFTKTSDNKNVRDLISIDSASLFIEYKEID